MQEFPGQEWIVPALAAALALLTLVLLGLLARERTRTRRGLQAAHAEAASLRAHVEEIERRLRAPGPAGDRDARAGATAEFVITHLGEPEPGHGDAQGREVARVDGPLFADLVLRETVVRAAALGHGLRRALAAETRHRIRFEVRRQTRAARKQRRRDLRDLARRTRAGETAPDAA